jgi:hypothetical protein
MLEQSAEMKSDAWIIPEDQKLRIPGGSQQRCNDNRFMWSNAAVLVHLCESARGHRAVYKEHSTDCFKPFQEQDPARRSFP